MGGLNLEFGGRTKSGTKIVYIVINTSKCFHSSSFTLLDQNNPHCVCRAEPEGWLSNQKKWNTY